MAFGLTFLRQSYEPRRSSYADDAARVTRPTWRSCSVLRGGRGSDPRPPASDRLYEGNTRFRRHGQGTAGVAAPPGARERRVPPTNCGRSAAAGWFVRREVDGLRAVVVSLRDSAPWERASHVQGRRARNVEEHEPRRPARNLSGHSPGSQRSLDQACGARKVTAGNRAFHRRGESGLMIPWRIGAPSSGFEPETTRLTAGGSTRLSYDGSPPPDRSAFKYFPGRVHAIRSPSVSAASELGSERLAFDTLGRGTYKGRTRICANRAGSGRSAFRRLKQLVVFILLILPGVYLGKLIGWHALDTALGWGALGVGTVILVLYPSRKGYRKSFAPTSTGEAPGCGGGGGRTVRGASSGSV